MSKVNSLLTERLKKNDATSKMAAMARQSANGQLTSFSGVFSVSELGEQEKSRIEEILRAYAVNFDDIHQDLSSLISITSEVKAINNQAALLHGERIKKAHTILTRYRDGAFTAWLMAAYGNRQTPYNLMQYYEFCEAMPKTLRLQIEAMPRQAIYTLATRDVPLEKKRHFVENYQGQNKAETLLLLRQAFPLDEEDGRHQKIGESTLQSLKRLRRQLKVGTPMISREQKEEILDVLSDLQRLIERTKTH